MPFFRRDSPPPPASPTVASPSAGIGGRPATTLIARGTTFSGTITGAVEVRVEGEVDGEIRTEAKVEVGPEGQVRGPITAPVVLIAGQVTGDVRAGDRVEVAPSGALEGDIAAPRIVVAEGAYFKGKVEMQGEVRERRDKPTGTGRPARSGSDSKATAETGKS